MIPGLSKVRQIFWVTGLAAALAFAGRPEKTPDHAYFTTSKLNCSLLRRIAHQVTTQGQLPWQDPLLEPEAASERILEELAAFHKEYRPRLKPIKGWPHVELLQIERVEDEHEPPYRIHWQAQYSVAACKNVPQARAEFGSLTAHIQKK